MLTPEVEIVEETGGVAADLHGPIFGREGTRNWFVSKSSIWGCQIAVEAVFSLSSFFPKTFPKKAPDCILQAA